MALSPAEQLIADEYDRLVGNQNMIPNQPGAYEEPGVLGSVLQFLSWFDKPRNALATSVKYGTDESPATTWWEGLKRGWSQQEDTRWTDVFGLGREQKDQSWPEWLARMGAGQAVDFVLDPLNIIGGLGVVGKAGKGASTAEKVLKGGLAGMAVEKGYHLPVMSRLAGSPVGRLFAMPSYDRAGDEIMNAIAREARPFEAEQLAQGISTKLDELIRGRGISDPGTMKQFRSDTLFEALERPHEFLKKYPEHEDLLELLRPLQQLSEDKFVEYADILERMTGKKIGMVEDPNYKFMPRIVTAEGKWQRVDMPLSARAAEPRPIKKWYKDPELTEPVTIVRSKELTPPTGELKAGEVGKPYRWMEEPLVGKVDDPRTGITMNEHGEYFHEGRQVFKGEASKLEAQKIAPKRAWIDDPVTALTVDIQSKQRKIAFLQTVEQMERDGLVKRVKPIAGYTLKDMNPELAKTHRFLRVNGLRDYIAPKNLANVLEGRAGIYLDPESVTGKLEQFIGAIWKTKIGEMMKAYTNTWKSWTLGPFPGFHAANIISNAWLMHQSGIRNVKTVYDGFALRLAKKGAEGASSVPGLSLGELRQEFARRGLIDQGSVSLLGDLADEMSDVNRIPFFRMAAEKAGKAGEKIANAADAANKIPELAFRGAAAVEDGMKASLAIDYLKKLRRAPTPVDLDDAVKHAFDFIGNMAQSSLSGFERELRNYVPFYSWYRFIVARTLKDMGMQPNELANIGRFLDRTFMPLNEEDRRLSPEWIQEGGPVQGIAGIPFGGNGAQNIALTGRFVPQGTIEQMISRPGESALSLINPILKTPLEALQNYSFFKDRAIDPIASSGPAALAAPLTGGAYSKSMDKTLGVRLPAAYEYLLANATPAGRAIRTGSTLARGTLYEEPDRPQMTWKEKAAYGLTGGKFFPQDRQRNRYYASKAIDQQIRNTARLKKKYLRSGDLGQVEFYRDQELKLRMEKRRRLGMGVGL